MIPASVRSGSIAAAIVGIGIWAGLFIGLPWYAISKRRVSVRAGEADRPVRVPPSRRLQLAVARVMHRLLEDHAATLRVQQAKLAVPDRYGAMDPTAWRKELAYFASRVVVPALRAELGERKYINYIKKLAWQYAQSTGHSRCTIDDTELIAKLTESHVHRYIDDSKTASDATSTQAIESMNPLDFEHHCARLLEQAGWRAEVVAGAGDQGVDVVARRDGVVAVFQCKLYSSPLGNTPVQEVHTGRLFYKADHAAVVSNAEYTKGARAAAQVTGVQLLHYSELATFRVRQDSGLDRWVGRASAA
ncbi:MAG: restriction endonuclease [Planctomycetota bacterium]